MVERGVYRHYKGGLYEVLGMAEHTETEEPLVIYYPLGRHSELWARPEYMWDDYINAEIKRFTKVW